MVKSILLLDTPKNCVKCRFSVAHDYSFYSEQTTYTCTITGKDTGCRTDGWLDDKIFKADWCPLKPLPEKCKIDRSKCGDPFYDFEFEYGYNKCIDEILGD